jgi:hypothetical protein
MKLTKETLKKIIEEEVENFNKFLQEKVDPKRFPTKLSQVNPEIAKQVTTQGKNDGDAADDAKDVNVKEYSVSELKPSQSSMNLPKSLGMLVAMINGKMPSGGNLGGFISSDNFIMDGHHRWVSTAMLNPKLKVAGYVVNMPASDLIPVLNAITVGRLGITKGKQGTGSFAQFQKEPIQKEMLNLIKKGNKFVPPQDVKAAFQKYVGQQIESDEQLVAAAAQKAATNLSNVKFQLPANAPARPDMPVIDKDKVPNADKIAIAALKQGEVDIEEPYAKIKESKKTPNKKR